METSDDEKAEGRKQKAAKTFAIVSPASRQRRS
jgi:hypothetical protein